MQQVFNLLRQDKLTFTAAIFFCIVLLCACLGPLLVGEAAGRINLRARNLPPFQADQGWLYILGADALGRSILARVIVAARTTMGIALGVVAISMLFGAALGLLAGMSRGLLGQAIMRGVDVVMSFPPLLLAMIVLYVLGPSPINIIAVLGIARLPVYIRTTRARVVELLERPFVSAAWVLGAGKWHVATRHVLPSIIPTLCIIGSLDFAYVMLGESALSFLGLGVQPPTVTWGLMVSEGRSYLTTAWWLCFWPGLAIMLTALAANLVAIWLRLVGDPAARTRAETGALADV